MNIPYTTVEPFEPLSIPTLTLIEPLAENIIGESLASAFKVFCQLDLDDDEEWITETLKLDAEEHGAKNVTVARQEIKRHGKVIGRGYLVDFYIDGEEWPHMRLLINTDKMKNS